MRALFALLWMILLALPLSAQGNSAAAIAATPTTKAPAPVGEPSPNDLHEFSRLLADPRIQHWIETQATASETTASTQSQSLRDSYRMLVARISDRLATLGVALANPDHIPTAIAKIWREDVPKTRQVHGLTFAIIFLFTGAGLEWLLRQYTNPLLRRVESARFDTAGQRLRAALVRTGLTLAGLVVFSVGSIGGYAVLSWPPVLGALILVALEIIIGIRVARSVLVLFLAPRVKSLRLIPVSTPIAKILMRSLFVAISAVIAATALTGLFSSLTERTGADTNDVLAMSVMLAAGCFALIQISIFLCFMRVRKQRAYSSLRSLRGWRIYSHVLTLLVFALWILDLDNLMMSILVIGLIWPTVRLLQAWVDVSMDRASKDHLARIPSEAPDPSPVNEADVIDPEPEPDPEPWNPYVSYRPIAHRVVRFAVVIVAAFSLELIWNVGVFEQATNPTVLHRIMQVVIDSAAAILIADLVWTWARSAIDRRLKAYRPPEPGSAPGPEARMATLLPLLRVTLMVTLLLMVVMSVLSSMGFNIAPILAGASVMGIAIGFGAQSLVKDVVSGIFFLIDDAFRIGEYVEIDQLRGTVERISIRSLQIRHHRGAVHTLPFGELKSLTNYSRDWVIMKLEFRVPFDTDLKLVKKLVKKVGADLLANPDYGHSIIQTLKSQGVRRMEEFNMVIGVKFMTKPGEQWLVRRDAYQGVRDIFEANGIRMAERNVKVEISGDKGDLTEEDLEAIGAAAQETAGMAPPSSAPDKTP